MDGHAQDETFLPAPAPSTVLKLNDFIIDPADDLADLFGDVRSDAADRRLAELPGLRRDPRADRNETSRARRAEAKEGEETLVGPTEADLLMIGLTIIAAASQY